MIFTRMTISRTHPNTETMEVASQDGSVLLRFKDLEGNILQAEVSLENWSRALTLHKPVTAWLTTDLPLKEVA